MKIIDYPGYDRKAVFHPQIARIMKLTMLFLTICLIQVSAATKAQITLNERNAPLQKALKSISKQSGYDFIYSDQDLTAAKPVTLNLSNATLETALQLCFENQPLLYVIQDKTILIKQKQQSFLEKLKDKITEVIAAIDVHGQVVDETGQGLPNATVRVKNTSNATITDAKGYFSLSRVDPGAILQISFVGYTQLEIKAQAEMGTVKMVKSADKLDEVQIIAYGETSLRTSTGNVTTIKADVLAKQPVDNPLAAIEGRVPGMLITQTSGLPESGFTVQIRGQSSLNPGASPLYIVDGIPYNYTSQSLGISGANGGSTTNNNAAGFALDFINMSDIESIDILKDAGATAIYGSRGANGVVLITTKKGKAGAMLVNASYSQGYSARTYPYQFLNTPEYIQLRQQAYRNDGITVLPASASDINGTWDMNSYTNWAKLLTGNTAHYTQATVDLSGGTATTTYLVSGNYLRQSTIFPGDFADQKGGLHFNLNTSSQDKRFKISLTGSFTTDQNNSSSNDLSSYQTLAPDAPSVFTPAGTLNWANSTWSNPFAIIFQPNNISVNNLLVSSVISYQIMPGLEIKSNLGYTLMQAYQYQNSPLSSQDPALKPVNSATFYYENNHSYNIEPQLTYKKNIGRGTIDALLGVSIQQLSSNGSYISASNYSSDALLNSPTGAATISAGSTASVLTRYNSLFGRLSYNYQDKYIVDLTGRRDGSSRFGPGKQFGNFGSAAGAWVFTKEDWFKNIEFINFGKLRASYGVTGNDQIKDYGFLSTYSAVGSTSAYQGVAGLYPRSLTNPEYSWEVDKKLEAGLDLGFFKDRIIFSGDYYRQRSSSLLGSLTLPSFVGPGSVPANLPGLIQNTGLEFSLNTINIRQKDFSWTSNFNISFNRNKLVSYPDFASSSLAQTRILGASITTLREFHSVGVNPETGAYQFVDANGNLTYTPSYGKDYTTMVDLAPKYFGGLENSFSYKGFQLSFLLQFVRQMGIDPAFALNNPGQTNSNNITTVWDNMWHQPGDNVRYEKATTSTSSLAYQSYNYVQASDYVYVDASYIRLRNVALSYTLPKQWISHLKLSSAKLFLNAQNLYTFTGFKGDPEIQSPSYTPALRTIVAGLQFNF